MITNDNKGLVGGMVADSDVEKRARIVAARMRLMARVTGRSEGVSGPGAGAGTDPSLERRGTGGPNRHGMPRLPVGQTETHKWPVLDLGVTPHIAAADWRLEVNGACGRPRVFTFETLNDLGAIDGSSDFHCVTRWSQMDLSWRGVRLLDLLTQVDIADDATHLMAYGSDDYCTNIALAEALKPDVLIAWQVNGAPLPAAHGGPVRMITPQLYAWKGAKWISRIELMTRDRAGFWEDRGYSMSGLPWADDRYQDGEPESLF